MAPVCFISQLHPAYERNTKPLTHQNKTCLKHIVFGKRAVAHWSLMKAQVIASVQEDNYVLDVDEIHILHFRIQSFNRDIHSLSLFTAIACKYAYIRYGELGVSDLDWYMKIT